MKLLRYYMGADCTLGILTDETGFLLHTLENPWKGNQGDISCIPSGVYEVKPFSGAKYNNAYEVKHVPDRSAILMHWGNTEKDTEGCILVGSDVGVLGVDKAVLGSRPAFKRLTEHVGLTNSFTLYIKEV